jgi:hypothetical protein
MDFSNLPGSMFPMPTPVFPKYSGQAVPMPPASQGVMTYCKQNATVITILLVVLAAVVTLFMVYTARQKVQANSPFAAKIELIENESEKEDVKEWVYLWNLARRKNVKKALRDVVDVHLNNHHKNINHPGGQEAIQDEGDHFIAGGGSDEEVTGFTPL